MWVLVFVATPGKRCHRHRPIGAMAEHNTDRPASRRTTSAVDAASSTLAKQTTRITRSQSRDISDGEERRIGMKPRRGPQQAPSGSVNHTGERSRAKESKSRLANQSRVLQGTSTGLSLYSREFPALLLGQRLQAG